MPSALLQKLLGELRAARAQATASERGAIDAAIVDILEGILAAGGMPAVVAPSPGEPKSAPPPVERPMSKLSPFYGIGLKEACPRLLSLVGSKTPQTAREIWEQLKAEGWTSAHHDPVHAVNDALRRRAKTHGDVMLVGAGKWGKTEWYSDSELEEIRKSMGGMGGRDRADHIERTKAGMITARRRGARLGAVNKLSDEQIAQLLEMVRTGTVVHKIAEHFGISSGTVYNCLRAKGYTLQELRDEGEKLRATVVDPSTENESGETRH
jgi:transposase